MAAQRGKQFPDPSIEVSRGIPGRLGLTGAGEHWTTDDDVANYFSGRNGSIIRADVPLSSIETDTEVLRAKGVGDTQSNEFGPLNEKEVTVKKGAPLVIKSIKHQYPMIRTRRYDEAQKTIISQPHPDYPSRDWSPEDDKKLDAAYNTVNRTRTRTYKRGKRAQA